jgi:hypothetical protein
MDDRLAPSSVLELCTALLQRFRGARCTSSPVCSRKTAQESRELIKFNKDRLEVLRLPLNPSRTMFPNLLRGRSDSQLIGLHVLRCRRILKDSTFSPTSSLPIADLTNIPNLNGLCNPQRPYPELLNNQPRNCALAPLAPHACLIVIAQNAGLRNPLFIIPEIWAPNPQKAA